MFEILQITSECRLWVNTSMPRLISEAPKNGKSKGPKSVLA